LICINAGIETAILIAVTLYCGPLRGVAGRGRGSRASHEHRRWNVQTPVEIDFRGMAGTANVRSAISQHVTDLEKRYGRVTACRVVLKAPGGHHQTGGLYEVNIRLALPDGREVDVGRTAQADERHSDLTFAVNDAFKRARRRLQDHVRRLQGQVKQHEDQPIGTVVRLDASGEFGILESGDGREIYFHRNSVLDGAFSRLTSGSRVIFAEEMGEKGPQASTVKPLGKHRLRA
jgi:cold shock CspA family protein/ribosome-associated translation inhibitor RaiA